MPRPTTGRAAFSLIELLVVFIIIAVSVGVMIPGITASREAARRCQCVNNLKQLALALHNYDAFFQVFPPGVVNSTGPIHDVPVLGDLDVGWIVQLLPHIEQNALSRVIDTRFPVYAPENRTAAVTRISSLVCPSDRRGGGTGAFVASSYAGCHHDVEAPIDADQCGVLFLNSRVSREDITDGTSSTILVGEKAVVPPDMGWMYGTRATLRNTGTPINATLKTGRGVAGAALGDFDDLFVGGFGSGHPGGANFAFGDGSVRFLSEHIDRPVYRRLGHRSDGELVEDAGF